VHSNGVRAGPTRGVKLRWYTELADEVAGKLQTRCVDFVE